VRTRGFVLSTILIPAFVLAVTVLPYVFGMEGGERTIVIVDETPTGVGARIARTLAAADADDEDAVHYHVERTTGPLPRVRADLNRRVEAEEIDGYLVLPADVVEHGRAQYRARDVANFKVVSDLQRAASDAVRAERLAAAGLAAGEVAALVAPVEVQTTRITGDGTEGGDAISTFFFAYGVAMLIYFLIVLYGQNVMRSVLEEKTSRIAEVIVSTVRASHLMLGKVLGVGSVALTQVAMWGVGFAVAALQTDLIAERMGVPPEALAAFHLAPGVGLALAGFFLGGFLLYASLYAAVGAAVTTEQEAQQFVLPGLLPLMIPLLFLVSLASDPQGPVARTLGLIPFTSPIAMPMRMATTELPAVEVAASLGILALSVVLAVWLAGKIYRVGILSTGKRPTFRDLARWLRSD
ncbi:MAG TPA: ABC transporter permease, partial [Rhodothermales bacterium]|nr:ABC transporter permease [Rhodothermales bacterium]